jgi:hypothetical protein
MDMKLSLISIGAAAFLTATSALAADHDAGVPLAPSDAAGPWTLEDNGRSLCVITLGAQKVGDVGYGVRAPADCQPNLPGSPAAWTPTDHGMKLVSADGQTLLAFGRWSDSLFVTGPNSPTNLQLRRGH